MRQSSDSRVEAFSRNKHDYILKKCFFDNSSGYRRHGCSDHVTTLWHHRKPQHWGSKCGAQNQTLMSRWLYPSFLYSLYWFCPPVATVLVVLVEYTVLVPPFGNPMSKLPTKLTPHWLCPSFIESQVGADGHEHSSWPSSYRLTPLRNNHVITKHERAHFYSSKRRLFSFRVSLPSSSSIAVIELTYKNSAGCWSHLWHTFILNSKDWRLERRAEEQRAWN